MMIETLENVEVEERIVVGGKIISDVRFCRQSRDANERRKGVTKSNEQVE